MAKTFRAGTFANPRIIVDDTALQLSKSGVDISDARNTQLENRRLNKEAIANEYAKLQSEISKVGPVEDGDVVGQFRDVFSTEIDKLNEIQLESIGKDQSEVIKQRQVVNDLLNQFPKLIEGFKYEKDKYDKAIDEEGPNAISDLTNVGYRNMVENQDKIKVSNVGGNFILEGEYLDSKGNLKKSIVNGDTWMKNIANGVGLIRYNNFDLNKFAKMSKPYLDSIKTHATTIQKYIDDESIPESRKRQLIQEEVVNYDKALANAREGIETDPSIQIAIRPDDYQVLQIGEEVWSNTPEQRLATQKGIADAVLLQSYPQMEKMKDPITGEEVDVYQYIKSIKASPYLPAQTKKDTSYKFNSYTPDVDEIVQGISNLKNDPEKGQTYFIGKKIKGREINKVKVDGNSVTFTTRSITPGGKTVDKEEVYNLNNTNSINNLEDDLIKTIIGSGRDAQKAREYAHNLTNQLISDKEDFSIPKQAESLTLGQWEASEEDLVGGEDKDDEDYKKGTLYQLYPDFEFEQSGFGTNRVIAKTKDGKNKTKELVTGKEEDLKVLLDFIEKHSNTSESNSLAKAQALIEMYKQ